jgi:hypothetical protein
MPVVSFEGMSVTKIMLDEDGLIEAVAAAVAQLPKVPA